MHSLPNDDCVRKGRTCGYAEYFVQSFAGKKAPIVIKKKTKNTVCFLITALHENYIDS